VSRTILVEGKKTFRITVPDSSKLTFGPWSPSNDKSSASYNERALNGTLRVYENAKSGAAVLAVFSGVTSYRDITNIEYEEQVIIEKGSTIWENDRHGYKREESVSRKADWTDPLLDSGE
jgi:hypothetical protein